jgi:hypothetical protein
LPKLGRSARRENDGACQFSIVITGPPRSGAAIESCIGLVHTAARKADAAVRA